MCPIYAMAFALGRVPCALAFSSQEPRPKVFPKPATVALILAPAFLFAPMMLASNAQAAETVCRRNLKQPLNIRACSEIAPFGKGASATVFTSEGGVESWIVTPTSKSKLGGLIAVADVDAVAYVVSKPEVDELRLRTLKSDRLIASFPNTEAIVPLTSTNGREGTLNPKRKIIVIYLADRASNGDGRSALAVVNLLLNKRWVVPVDGLQELSWETDTRLRVGTRVLDTATGDFI